MHETLAGPRKGADRSFFVYHKENKSQQIFIGEPVISRTNGKWVITISRRLETHTGAFNGVVVVTLGIENFLTLYGQINIGHAGVIGLTTQTGVLLIRYPLRIPISVRFFRFSSLQEIPKSTKYRDSQLRFPV